MPLVFSPVLVNKEMLIDGGILMPVPVRVVRQMGADIVIAVNLNSTKTVYKPEMKSNIYSVSQQAINIMINNTAEMNVEDADIVINPSVQNIHWSSLLKNDDKRSAIQKGELAMEAALPRLQALITFKSSKLNINSFTKSLRSSISKLLFRKSSTPGVE